MILRIMGVDLANRVVHLDKCEAAIDTMLDLDGEETTDPALADQVIAKIPDEFPLSGGQWLLIPLEQIAADTVH